MWRNNSFVFKFGVLVAILMLNFIAIIIKLKFCLSEQHWFILSIVYTFFILVGLLIGFKIGTTSIKKGWLRLLINVGIIVIMFFLITYVYAFVTVLTGWVVPTLNYLLFTHYSFSVHLMIATFIIAPFTKTD